MNPTGLPPKMARPKWRYPLKGIAENLAANIEADRERADLLEKALRFLCGEAIGHVQPRACRVLPEQEDFDCMDCPHGEDPLECLYECALLEGRNEGKGRVELPTRQCPTCGGTGYVSPGQAARDAEGEE